MLGIEMAEETRYRFGPREQRGVIAGWRVGQLGSIALGLIVAVLALRAQSNVAGIFTAALAIGSSAAFSFWPISGRTGDEWLPSVVRWCGMNILGRRVERSTLATAGEIVVIDVCKAESKNSGVSSSALSLVRKINPFENRTTFAGLKILRVDSRSDSAIPMTIGVIHDVYSRTFTAVLKISGHSFALLSPSEKQQRISGWSSALASLSREGGIIRRLQWIASTIPDDASALSEYFSKNRVLDDESEACKSYQSLLQSTGTNACRHEVRLAVQIKNDRTIAKVMKQLGGGTVGACAILSRETAALRRYLDDVDICVEGLLGPEELYAELRSLISGNEISFPEDPLLRNVGIGALKAESSTVQFEPVSRHVKRIRPHRSEESFDREIGRSPWPIAISSQWSRVQTDDFWHATYWIAEWPRIDVSSDFLGPLLLSTVRRSVSVIMEPLTPTQAIRQVEHARTADLADNELRRRGGFLNTARRSRESAGVVRREGELADGHASFRFSGFVTISASTIDMLEEACAITEQHAGQCRLELRRLYGDQAVAFTYSLPLGRGLS